MIQAKSVSVYGTVGTRFGRKETTLPAEIDKAANALLEEIPEEKFKGLTVSPLGSAIPDAVLVTVLFEAEPKPKSKTNK